MTAIAVGEPPKTFDLEYRDDDKNCIDKNLTPVGASISIGMLTSMTTVSI